MRITQADLEFQYNKAKTRGWLPFFQQAGYGLAPELLMGIASRETNMCVMLGDGGHGHGLMQIDDRSYPEWCRTDKWKDPQESIRMGAFVMRSKYNYAKECGVPPADLLRVSVAAYNAGPHAFEEYLIHQDPDRVTTGRDYSSDVIARTIAFKRLLAS